MKITLVLLLLTFSLSASSTDLYEEFQRYQDEAKLLAGSPSDISRRVMLLEEIFHDSNSLYEFPVVALHGALFMKRLFKRSEKILSNPVVVYHPLNILSKSKLIKEIKLFMNEVQKINRQVFVDVYSHYYFIKDFLGEDLTGVVQENLLKSIEKVHYSNRYNIELFPIEKKSIFKNSLLFEQNSMVSKRMENLFDKLSIGAKFLLKANLRFEYFPQTEYFLFRNYFSKRQRINDAIRAYDIAIQVGFGQVLKSMKKYNVLPNTYFNSKQEYWHLIHEPSELNLP